MEHTKLDAIFKMPLYWIGQEAMNACVQLDVYQIVLNNHLDTVIIQNRLRSDQEHESRLADLDFAKVDPIDTKIRNERKYLTKVEKEWYDKQKDKQDLYIAQMAWNSFIISCWATYEMYFEQLGDYAREKKDLKLRSNKIKGDKNDRLKVYFSSILDIQLPVDDSDFTYLDHLYIVRNAIAHGNGNINEVFNDKQKKLQNFVLNNRNIIKLNGKYLCFGKPFAVKSLNVVTRVLKQINHAVRIELGYF